MIKLPVPELKTGKPIILTAKPDDMQKAYMKELATRSEAIHNGNIDPSTDNMCERYVTATNHEETVTKAVADVC